MEIERVIDEETGAEIIELRQDGILVGVIYPHEEGIRVVSEHLDGVQHETGWPPAVVVRFST